MKRFLMGFLAGLVLAASVPVFASQVSNAALKILTPKTLTVDGKAIPKKDPKFGNPMWYVEITDSDAEKSGLYVRIDNILALLQNKDTPYRANYDAGKQTLDITTKAPFKNGKPIREVLSNLEKAYKITNDISFKDGKAVIDLDLSGAKARLTYDVNKEAAGGKAAFDKKSASFRFYIAADQTLIVEESLIEALKEIGYIK